MRHKFNTPMPSLSWINAYLSRFVNQRVRCILVDDHWMIKSLVEDKIFDPNQPIVMNGIYYRSHKMPENGNIFGSFSNKTILNFLFRDIVFEQGGKTAWVLWRSRKHNKKHPTFIPYNEIKIKGVLDLSVTNPVPLSLPSQ